jgi:hypothetical protein
MALYTTIYLHNVPDDKVDAYRQYQSTLEICGTLVDLPADVHVGLVTFQAGVSG